VGARVSGRGSEFVRCHRVSFHVSPTERSSEFGGV
jgi:hypothetical protein